MIFYRLSRFRYLFDINLASDSAEEQLLRMNNRLHFDSYNAPHILRNLFGRTAPNIYTCVVTNAYRALDESSAERNLRYTTHRAVHTTNRRATVYRTKTHNLVAPGARLEFCDPISNGIQSMQIQNVNTDLRRKSDLTIKVTNAPNIIWMKIICRYLTISVVWDVHRRP
jgi:hypothetical protein